MEKSEGQPTTVDLQYALRAFIERNVLDQVHLLLSLVTDNDYRNTIIPMYWIMPQYFKLNELFLWNQMAKFDYHISGKNRRSIMVK